MLGLTADDLDVAEIWPENWPAVQLFCVLLTQWRFSPAGPSGLDYGPVPFAMRMHGIPLADQPDAFWALRVMEAETLRLMHKDARAHG